MNPIKVLVVDDDKMTYSLVNAAISKHYSVEYRSSGEQTIVDMEQLDVNVILLDILMGEGLDGYQTCALLREKYSNEQLQILFLSGLEQEDEIVKAYEVGGDDYIVKPPSQMALLKKMDVACRFFTQQDKVQADLSNIQQLAMNVMGVSSKLGQIIQYLNGCNKLTEFEDIANATVSIIDSWQLRCTVMISLPDQKIFCNYDGDVSSLEKKLMTTVMHHARIYDIREHTFFNYPYLSVFIHNMPLNDEQEYGNFKDNIALLVEGASARIKALMAIKALEYQQQTLNSLLAVFNEAQQAIEQAREDSNYGFISLVEELESHLERTFSFLDLSEDQEQAFLQILSRIRQSHQESERSREMTQIMILKLTQLSQQAELPGGFLTEDESTIHKVGDDDIELF